MEIDKQDIDIMIEHALANYNRRTIVLWGKYRKSDQIRKRLVMQYQIENILYVDSDKKRQNGKDVFDPNYIRNKKDSMYIVIPLDYYVEIAKLLDDGGYIKEKDYYYHYACDCINESENYYEDAYGNKIYGRRGQEDARFSFSGSNNIVKIGEETTFNNCRISLGDNCILNIGNETSLYDCRIRLYNNAKATIGSNGVWSRGTVEIFNNGILQVGDDFTIGSDYMLMAKDNTRITIGNDCMFSWNITFLSSDGHAIFDKSTGKRINDTISDKRKILIGNHVWIGANAMVLYDTLVEDGSIVGANSLVKGKFPANCICGGNPAKLIRKNIVWCRDNNVMDYYGENGNY